MVVSLVPEPGMSVVSWAAADTTVVNTTVDSALCSLAVPKTVKAGDFLELVAAGDMLNNSGSSVTQTIKFKLGGTTALLTPAGTLPTNAFRRIWNVRVSILVESTSAQRVFGRFYSMTPSSNTWQSGSGGNEGYGTAAEDLTAGKNAALTVTYGTAASTIDMVLHAAALTHVRS